MIIDVYKHINELMLSVEALLFHISYFISLSPLYRYYVYMLLESATGIV